MLWDLCSLAIWWQVSTISMVEVDLKAGSGMSIAFLCYEWLLTLWYRLFIVDGIISLPIALLGYFVLPDIPEIAKPFYLTKEVRSPKLTRNIFFGFNVTVLKLIKQIFRKLLLLRRECSLKEEKRGNRIQKQSLRRFSPPGTSTFWRFSICKVICSAFSAWRQRD